MAFQVFRRKIFSSSEQLKLFSYQVLLVVKFQTE